MLLDTYNTRHRYQMQCRGGWSGGGRWAYRGCGQPYTAGHPQTHSVKQVTINYLWQFLSVSRVSCRTAFLFRPHWRVAWRRPGPPAVADDGRWGDPPWHPTPAPHSLLHIRISEVYYPSMSSLALGNKSCQVSKLLLTTRIMTTEPKSNTGLMPLTITFVFTKLTKS